MNPSTNTPALGVTTFPAFGGHIGGNSSSIATIDSQFNGVVSTLKSLPVVPGNEVYATQGWLLLKQAYAMFEIAYCGKATN